MALLIRFWNWFSKPESPVWAAWFRIGVALFSLFKLWSVRHSIIEIWGQYGLVQWAITRGNMPEWLPHLGNFALLLEPHGITADQTVQFVVGSYVFALTGLLLGIATRWMAALAWVLDFLLMHAGGGVLYGMDYFTHIALFYCIIAPCGSAITFRRLRAQEPVAECVSAGVTHKMLQVQMCIVYVSSGIEKAMGIQWWNGEAIWRALTLPVFEQFYFGWLAWWPALAMLVGWSVLVAEVGYGFAMWFRRTRLIWLAMIVGMHLGIAMFMGMWLFALVMILLSLGAFGDKALNDLSRYWDFLRHNTSASVPAPSGAVRTD